MTGSPVRFFIAWRRSALPAFSLVIALGAWLYYLEDGPSGLDSALGLALVIQMFAAATGFREPAVLGEFDLLLTRTSTRWPVVVAHGAVSAAPVAGAWLLLAVFDCTIAQRGWPTALTLGPLAAFLWVSAAAWATGAWLGRNTAGALWMLAVFVLGASGYIRYFRDAYSAPPGDALRELARVGATLVFPFFTFTDATAVTRTLAFTIAIASAVVGVASTVALARADIPLRTRS